MRKGESSDTNKEGINMASVTKPNVFEVIIDKENFDKTKEKIDEIRLSKSFLQDCLEVAKKLTRGNQDK
ncbi:MAG: hypothetical protein J1F01_02440 [Oscillospiraceae bacterium]|nr:hypothetical protein [Oscillospiraceae bacterium]